MFVGREKEVTVKKSELLQRLEANLIQHRADYAEAIIGYKEKLKIDFQTALNSVNSLTPEELAARNMTVSCVSPVSHEGEFVETIEMLKASVSEEIKLDASSFNAYWRNQWNWSKGFEGTVALYKSFNNRS